MLRVRLSTALPIALALLPAGCHKDSSPPGKPSLPPRPPFLSGSLSPAVPSGVPADLARLLADAGARRDHGAALAEKEIARIRERELALAPRRVPEQRIAFGRKALGQLTSDALVVWNTTNWKQRTRIPIIAPRALVVLDDGSFLALSSSSSYVLAPGQKTAEHHPHVAMFPGSVAFPDLLDKRHFWVMQGFDEMLNQYQLESSVASQVGMGPVVELKGFDHQAFVELKDGSFLYTTQNGLRRFYPRGKQFDMKAPPGEGRVWRLLATKRIDEVWIARGDGELLLAQLGAALRVKKKIELPGKLFDIDANDSYLAALRVERPDGGLRQWKLDVYDGDGDKELEETLPRGPAPPPGENWVQAVTRNRSVVLARREPLVAVGGPGALSVWNVKTGKRVFSP